MKIKSRKGVISLPLVIITLFVVSILLIFSGFIFDKFKAEVLNEPAFNNTQVQNVLTDTSKTLDNFDRTMFFLFIAFVMFLIISSFLIRTNTIFVGFMVIFLILVLVFSMVISNVYQNVVAGDEELETFVNESYPITNHILNNLPFYMFITDLFALMALFAKPGGGSQSI